VFLIHKNIFEFCNFEHKSYISTTKINIIVKVNTQFVNVTADLTMVLCRGVPLASQPITVAQL